MCRKLTAGLLQVNPTYVAHASLDGVNILIMWDGQNGAPAQNCLSHVPYSQLSWRQYATEDAAIQKHFLPALEVVWECMCKSAALSPADILAFGKAVAVIQEYFEKCDWTTTWMSSKVRKLSEAALRTMHAMATGCPADENDVAAAYEMLQHYLKSLTVPPPADDVSVCHASHHGTQALSGLAFQLRHGKALVIWDHCIYLRERLLWSDCAEPNVPYLVREMLARLHRVAAVVLYRMADLVVPCCATFNVGWERWLGRPANTILPVLNGLDVGKYPLPERTEPERPTVVMLSHVYGAKDVLTAIRAAKVIVEDYRVRDYQLLVFGKKDHDPAYCLRCEKLIEELGLQDNVKLMGLGKPQAVLQTGWCFLQSSVTEGLPVALLEAGLRGVCVVCTDVGGCSELMGTKERRFGRLTAARNTAMIAYGQLELLAMLPSLTTRTLQAPPDVDLGTLHARLRDPAVARQRWALGQQYREFIVSKFSMSVHAMQQRQALYLGHYGQQCKQQRVHGGG